MLIEGLFFFLLIAAAFAWGVYAGLTAPWRVSRAELEAEQERASAAVEAGNDAIRSREEWKRRAQTAEGHLSAANATLDRRQTTLNRIRDEVAKVDEV